MSQVSVKKEETQNCFECEEFWVCLKDEPQCCMWKKRKMHTDTTKTVIYGCDS
jgi:hypothetical protein